MKDRYTHPPDDGSEPDLPSDESAPWADLDEYLCEYVDGTMEPAVRAAFEEVLAANPGARAHAESLRRTRMLLGGCPCAARAPRDLRHRLHGHLASEMTCGRGSTLHSARWLGASVVVMSAFLIVALGVALSVPGERARTASSASDSAPRYQAPIRATPRATHFASTGARFPAAPPEVPPRRLSAKPPRISTAQPQMSRRILDAPTPGGVHSLLIRAHAERP